MYLIRWLKRASMHRELSLRSATAELHALSKHDLRVNFVHLYQHMDIVEFFVLCAVPKRHEDYSTKQIFPWWLLQLTLKSNSRGKKSNSRGNSSTWETKLGLRLGFNLEWRMLFLLYGVNHFRDEKMKLLGSVFNWVEGPVVSLNYLFSLGHTRLVLSHLDSRECTYLNRVVANWKQCMIHYADWQLESKKNRCRLLLLTAVDTIDTEAPPSKGIHVIHHSCDCR